ncbi:MAG TPA: hypothetical protein VJK03_00710 [Candidatus Nanoarchaeia archaeon]|nr:hypothetical protein [Candidatus Nanoarchaeia archaeon]
MAIDIERILTISATEWFGMNKKKPSEYEARGIHCHEDPYLVTEKFAKRVPSEAEVVVGYRVSSSAAGHNPAIASGTALILRKK